jgi:hypothetical protein
MLAFLPLPAFATLPASSPVARRCGATSFKFNGQIYLLEFKAVKKKTDGVENTALHADKYCDKHQPIYFIGIEFGKKARDVLDFRREAA